MDFKVLKFLLITLHYQIFAILALNTFNNGYLRTNTIKLDSNLPINYEIADLSELLNNNTPYKTPKRYLVKFVQTISNSRILKYVKYDDAAGKILLSNRLDLNELCNITSAKQSCSFNLQLIVLNQNKFIEIPIEITDARKIIEISLDENLNIGYKFIIDISALSGEAIDAKTIAYKLEEEFTEYDEILRQNAPVFRASNTFRLLISTSLNNKLIAVLNKKLSFKEQAFFRLKLTLLLNETKEISSEYVHISVRSSSISETTSILKLHQLTPLEFENSTYSLEIPSNIMINTEILQIKLKNKNINFNEDSISYSLVFDNEESINSLIISNYFSIDQDNGIIRTKNSIESLNIDLIKLNVKATYTNLFKNINNDDMNYFYNYLIPAFCVVKISIFTPTTTTTASTTYFEAPLTTQTNEVSTKELSSILTNYQSRIFNDLPSIGDVDVSNFQDYLNITGLNLADCVTIYETNYKEINLLNIKFQVLNQTRPQNSCFNKIEIVNSGCLKIDFNDGCDGSNETDFKFRVCVMKQNFERCSKVYVQNLTFNKHVDTNNKKNGISLFVDYVHRSFFNSAFLFYGFLVTIVLLFFVLLFLVCWLNRRKKMLVIKKSQQSHQESQEQEDMANVGKEFNFASIVSAIKYKMMNTRHVTSYLSEECNPEKVMNNSNNNGQTLPNSKSQIPSIQVLDDCFHSRQNLTLQDAFKKQNFFSIYMDSSPSVSSTEDFQSKYTRYLSLSKNSLENSSSNTNEDKFSNTEGVYSVKRASIENCDVTSTSTNYNLNELNQTEKIQPNKSYLDIINTDYNSMPTFNNNTDINNNYGQYYSKNNNNFQQGSCVISDDQAALQKRVSLKQWKKEVAYKKSGQLYDVSNNTSNSNAVIYDFKAALSNEAANQMNINFNINSSDNKNYKIYENNKGYCNSNNNKISNTDCVVASIV